MIDSNGHHRKRYYVTNAFMLLLAVAIVMAYWWIGAATTNARQVACRNQRTHVRNLDDWVKKLRANDEHLIPNVARKQRYWVEQRIRIFGVYLHREEEIDYGTCP